jgi:N6-adenosine-specific RNA methylase IME4
VVGKIYGESHKQVEKRLAVFDAAKAEPNKYRKLLKDLNQTGHVHGIYRRLEIAKKAERIRAEPPPLPGNGPYRVIVADPPWQFDETDEVSLRKGFGAYPRMTLKEICAKAVAPIAMADSILWLWCTNFHLLKGEAMTVARAWGFEPKTMLTWGKDRMGTGRWLRGQTEDCIVAVRGKPIVTLTDQTTLLNAPVRGHSVKPVFGSLKFAESGCPNAQRPFENIGIPKGSRAGTRTRSANGTRTTRFISAPAPRRKQHILLCA